VDIEPFINLRFLEGRGSRMVAGGTFNRHEWNGKIVKVFMPGYEGDEESFQQILDAVRRVKGFDGASYKPNYLKRRVAIRMRAVGADDYEKYLTVLRSDPREIQQLMDRLTVHVTEFFRDPEVYQAVENIAFPALDELFGAELWNAWSAGCSTGEEPYSMSIALREWRSAHGGGEYHVVALTSIRRAS
jgi:chemotaxis protein methyltransferase CheR